MAEMTMTDQNLRVVLANRPAGWVQESDFRIEQVPLPGLAEGQVLVRNHYLSLDPYMRGRMNAGKSYAAAQALDDVMIGGTVGVVAESRNPRFAVGDSVTGIGGWQEWSVHGGPDLRKVDARLPLSVYLGAVGMPGVTAWVGLVDICAPKAGETVVVSAAAGAVGSVVGQLAKARGARAVGIAGGAAKCGYVVEELGFDACVDYKTGNLAADLKAATPDGIHCLFENVGGEIFDRCMARMAPFGRIALCGMVSQYNATDAYGYRNLQSLLVNRVKLQGFIVSDDMSRWPLALAELAEGVGAGRIRYRETIAEGLDAAPAAFIGMLRGENLGKQLVKLI